MKSSDANTADDSTVREILSSLAAVGVLVENFRRELRGGVGAERAGSASSRTE